MQGNVSFDGFSFDRFNEELRNQGLECSVTCCGINCVSGLAGLALFIIGCVGAAGAFPGTTIGWVTVGLGGGSFALQLLLGNLKQRKWDLIPAGLIAATFVTLGVLGGTGVLAATQVGWGIIGTTLAACPLACCFGYLKQKNLIQIHLENMNRAFEQPGFTEYNS